MKIGHAELVGTFKPDSPEWHAARAEVIGGSDIASVLGLSPFKSAYTLWHEKKGLIAPEVFEGNRKRKLAYGNYMEPFIAAEFAAAHPELSVYETGSWRNIHRPWQGCNPDRLVTLYDRDVSDAHALVQIKTANFDADWEEGIPAGYLAQVKWELDTFNFPRGWLIVYFNVSAEYREYEIEVNDFETAAVRLQARRFADSLTEDAPPDLDGSDSTFQTVRRMHPDIDGTTVELPKDLAQNYKGAVTDAKIAAEDLNSWKAQILTHMGKAKTATHDGKKIAMRISKNGGIPYLKEANGNG